MSRENVEVVRQMNEGFFAFQNGDPAPADKVVNAVRGSSGYQELDLSRHSFQGYDAVHWEFTIQESGKVMHKEDEIFIDDYGDGVAILTQAPDSQYPDMADAFAQMRDSYTVK